VITGEGTPTATSKFEVTVNGKLVHTKVGDEARPDLSPSGFPDTPAKLAVVVSAMQAELQPAGKA